MKISSVELFDSLLKAIDWLDKQLMQAEPETIQPETSGFSCQEAGEIVDNFAKSARRVPRNICADPAVEAKRAVSQSLKSGLGALKKSVFNSLNEADENYIHEYLLALQTALVEYFGLQLNFLEQYDGTELRLQISLKNSSKDEYIVIRGRKTRQRAQSMAIDLIDSTGMPRPAEENDFVSLMKRP